MSLTPQWNGESCTIKHVNVEILASGADDFFKWWIPYVGSLLQAIKVTQNGRSFYIYDGDGSGSRKVLNGGGPNLGHLGFDQEKIRETNESHNSTVIRCKDHKWSSDMVPIFKTETKYCLNCRYPEIADKMLRSMR